MSFVWTSKVFCLECFHRCHEMANIFRIGEKREVCSSEELCGKLLFCLMLSSILVGKRYGVIYVIFFRLMILSPLCADRHFDVRPHHLCTTKKEVSIYVLVNMVG